MRKLFSFILSLLAPIARCNELDLCWELIAGLSRIKCAIAAFVNSANKCHVSTATLVLNSLSPDTFTSDIALNGDLGVKSPTATESALSLQRASRLL